MKFRVRVMTGRQLQGDKWAARRPGLADHLWVVVTAGGNRERIPVGPPTPENVAAAERKAEQLHQLLSRDGALDSNRIAAPTLRKATESYLKRAGKRLAPTTVRQRRQQLGQLCRHLGDVRIDRITADALTGWWSEFVEDGGRSVRTGKGHLEALAQVLADAQFHGTKTVSLAAVDEARRRIRTRNRRTKRTRQRHDASLDVAPLTPDQVAALGRTLEGARDHDARLFVVLGLDCGLRLGELLALHWEDFDGARLRVHRSLDAMGNLGGTKTGAERWVQVSRRARQLLKERRLECGSRARPKARVLRYVTRSAYRDRLAKLAESSGISDGVTPTTLRHTFGSILVMAGVPLSYVAAQLGHSSISVTEKHYARWIPGEDYRTPPPLAEDEVPADLLAGFATTLPTLATTTGKPKR